MGTLGFLQHSSLDVLYMRLKSTSKTEKELCQNPSAKMTSRKDSPTMAAQTTTKSVYGIINNIPPFYHAVDLRNYFSQFLETGGFQCFHFRHRPETQKRKEDGETPSTSAENEEVTSSK